MIPTEAEEGRVLVTYLRLKGYKFTHVANETGSGAGARFQGMRNKRQGTSKGFPDYGVIIEITKKTRILVFVELKRIKKSVTSPEQKEWIECLNNCDNTIAIIAKGANDAIDQLENIKNNWKILWTIYCGIQQRCNDKNMPAYHRYGGRGIKNNFSTPAEFFIWSIKNGYKKGLTIERIDNEGNYEPINCKWATRKEQANNRSSSHLITALNKTLTLQQWSEETGIGHKTILYRLKKGWSPEKALSIKPVVGRNQTHKEEVF